MADFKTLKVWQHAHALALQIHLATRQFPESERFGLTAQLRRATNSIAANLAEGCGRQGDNELRRFARIARGSCFEVESHLLLARDLRYMAPTEWSALDSEVRLIGRLLTGLVRSLG